MSAKAGTNFNFAGTGCNSGRPRLSCGRETSWPRPAISPTLLRNTMKLRKPIPTIPIRSTKAVVACWKWEPMRRRGMRSIRLSGWRPAGSVAGATGGSLPLWRRGTSATRSFDCSGHWKNGGLPPEQAIRIAKQAVEKYPSFAPLFLILGDLQGDADDRIQAIACYRKGLELVDEPDLETRLLCALAGQLPKETPERKELVRRAVSLNGSLVAQAVAAMLNLQ